MKSFKFGLSLESSAESPFQKLSFGDISKKVRKKKSFLSFTGFLYFDPNILSEIVDQIFWIKVSIQANILVKN